MIPVTKSFLPPLAEYYTQLERVWKNEWLTNRGELVLELEERLKEYLRVSNILVMNNGTIPLQIALKLLGRGGEIITTPFSYVATTAAIVWENCTPVFVDIDPEYLTIDATKIEAAITDRTTCILATHVFGNPCDVEAINAIALKYGLKVIYDGAHAFGVRYKGKSIFEYGDISTCSFHATKLFHTGEGGSIVCNDESLRHQVYYSHNFGHKGQLDFYGLGINGKMSELQAAMGLTVLPHMTEILSSRCNTVAYYNQQLDFNRLTKPLIRQGAEWNSSYYPVLFQEENSLLRAVRQLNDEDIFPRRYFYPSLNTIAYMKGPEMVSAEKIASQVLCLPLYYGLDEAVLSKIVNILSK